MTMRDGSFVVGEWYHCFNQSIEKRTAFADSKDYQRFLEILYLANDEFPLRRNDIGTRRFEEVLRIPRGEKLVSVGAFCLMPGHFHLVLKEISEGGITSFMRKLGTAYTLYFNSRNARTGNLFLKPFRSSYVSADRRLHQLIQYVHANPAELYEPGWKTGHVVDPQFVGEHLLAYPYSSLGIYHGSSAPTKAILDTETLSLAHTVPMQKMLLEARHYCADTTIP